MSLLTKPWLRYEVLAVLSRLSDPNLRDHALRCAHASGDLRAHGQFLLEVLPSDLSEWLGSFLYDQSEVDALEKLLITTNEFFDDGRWAGCLIPRLEEPIWTQLLHDSEAARTTVIAHGMPAWADAHNYGLR